MSIDVVYPGASPAETESGVVMALEHAVGSVKGVGKLHGLAFEGRARVVVEPTQDADLNQLHHDLRVAVTALSSLPPDADRPSITPLPSTENVVVVVVHGLMSVRTHRVWTQHVRTALLDQPNINRVSVVGEAEREVTITVDPARLHTLGARASDVVSAVQQHQLPAVAGPLVRVDDKLDVATLGKLTVKGAPNGRPFRIGDIATIEDGFRDRPTARVGKDPAALLLVHVPTSVSADVLPQQIANALEAAGHPDGKLSASKPVGISNCAVGWTRVSGPIVIADVDLAPQADRLPSIGGPPTVVLEGASVGGEWIRSDTQAQVIGVLTNQLTASKYLKSWREQLPTLESSIAMVSPARHALHVTLEHPDLRALEKAASKLEGIVGALRDVRETRRYPKRGKPELTYALNSAAKALGVTGLDVAKVVRGSTSGETVTGFADGRDLVPIIVKLGTRHRGPLNSIEQIGELTLWTAGGKAIQLSKIVSIEPQMSAAWIHRQDGRRRVTVRIGTDSDDARKSVEQTLRATLAQVEASAPGIKVTLAVLGR